MDKTILILEDEREVATLYEKYLRTNGYNPVLASDGLEGKEKLKKIKPDLILLDLAMPNMDGEEFYQYICGLDSVLRYPILVLTARLDLAEVFKDSQVEGILLKPFKATRLLHEIKAIFSGQGHAKRAIIVDQPESRQAVDTKGKERAQELLLSRECLATEITERKKLEYMVIQSEKMAAVGQLATGVAHEINNPISFISNNIEMLEQYVGDYTKVLRLVTDLKRCIEEDDMEKAKAISHKITELQETINLDYILNDVGKLLHNTHMGVERVKRIITDLRSFAREDHGETENVQIEAVMDSILSIVHNELKYKAELKKNYGDTPMVKATAQRLGQVFINLLVNAAQAIEEKGVIEIRTYQEGQNVYVDVSDTGTGITTENLKRIFEPFFTTKPPGQGTGLGLSISQGIIKKYGGEIFVRSSKVGEGTTFTVRLPIFVH